MKWFLCFVYVVVVTSFLLILPGCGSPEKTAEPTPDIKAKLQSDIDMENWFTEVQYAFGICSKALEIMERQVSAVEAGGAGDELARLVEYFNTPGKVYDRLLSKLKVIEKKSEELASVEGIDQTTYKNLTDLNNIYKNLVELVKKVPDNPADFREKVRTLQDQFKSIVKLMEKKFPQAAITLVQRRSPDNPEFRRDERLLKSIPTPVPTVRVEPTAVPTETPVPEEEKPVLMWRDKEGNLHFGQKPPEGVEVKRPEGPVTKSESSVSPRDTSVSPESTEQESEGQSTSSLIWTDKNGVVHMGSKAPEGVKTKRADDISLIQIKEEATPVPDETSPEEAPGQAEQAAS